MIVNSQRLPETDEDHQLVAAGWVPRGATLWTHEMFDRTQNYNYFSTMGALEFSANNTIPQTREQLVAENEKLRAAITTYRDTKLVKDQCALFDLVDV